MLLKPARMSRERIIISKDTQSGAITALHDLGVMQVEYLPEEAVKLMSGGESAQYSRISAYDQRFRSLEGMLYGYDVKKIYPFASLNELFAKADAIRIDERVAEIAKDMEALNASLKELSDTLGFLKRMPHVRHGLEIFSSEHIVSFLVEGKDLRAFDSEVRKHVNDCVLTNGEHSTIISMDKRSEQEFGSYVQKMKVNVEVVQKMSGTISVNEEKINSEIADATSRINALKAELTNISEIYYPQVSAIREQFDLEMEKVEITSKFGISRSIIAFEGWIPEEDIDRVKRVMKKVTNDKFIMEKIRTKELPPTKLENPVTTRLFEFFIKFYSLPRSDEFDPTLIFAIVFPIFFGFMIGDAGYGIVMLLGSLWLLRRLEKPPKKSGIPKSISNFVHTIVSNNGLKVIAKSIIPGAIIAVVLGIIFNEYFGFQLPYTPIFDVETGLPTLLVLSGWIGVFMVSFGFVLGFLNNLAVGRKKRAIGRIGWLMAAWGIVIFGLAVLHRQPLGFANIEAVASYFLLIAGVIIFLIAEGFESLMELPSLISHILSYTRLIGILLASVILAQVIDFIFMHAIKHSIILGIIGVVILLVGQLFNIAIALFEPGIQGARLIYVEFFSKFYSGNGNEFKPFASRRKRTLSTLE